MNENLPMSEDEIINSLSINTDSTYHLEQELKDNPKKAALYERLLLTTIKNVSKLKLDIEIRTAVIIEDYIKTLDKEVPVAYRQSLIRTVVPLDGEYQKLKREYNEAVSNKTYLEGLIRAWRDRGKRLSELCTLTNTIRLIDSGNYVDKRRIETKQKSANTRLEYD